MIRNLVCGLALVTALGVGACSTSSSPAGPPHTSVQTLTETLPDGSPYLMEVPQGWNGTLLLYSHGYLFPGARVAAFDAYDVQTGDWLLAHGYALAGSGYGTGFALEQALHDQVAVLDLFRSQVGRPTRTIAWGHSLGGMVTAALVQNFPQRFQGALPMCGLVGGTIGTANVTLDAMVAFTTLVAPGVPLQLVHVTGAQAQLQAAVAALHQAQQTPAGRARLALAAALGDVPGWYDVSSPAPSGNDLAGQEAAQAAWLERNVLPAAFLADADLESKAGGNMSWNTGVDYSAQLDRSPSKAEVAGLYSAAGLSLAADLAALNQAPRVTADPAAVDYGRRYIAFDGKLTVPVVTLHTTGDGYVVPEQESGYASAVQQAGDQRLLRQFFVQRAGHCTFTIAETLTALGVLEHKLATGYWGENPASSLDSSARTMADALAVIPQSAPRTAVTRPASPVPGTRVPPAFIEYSAPQFPRPYPAFDH